MAANANALLIEIWPIDRLRPYPRNPRKNDCAVDRMCASIRAFENIIGRKVVINSQPGTIVGVLPPDFYFLDRKTDIWGCLGLDPARDYRKTSGRWMAVVGRLREGVTIGEAQAHMTALARRLERAYPVFNTNWTVNIQSMRDALFPETNLPLLVLLAAVAMPPAVACANVANLLLARYSSRTREIAVRASLGAGRWRIARQLLTET